MAVFYVSIFGTVHRVHVSVVHIYQFLIVRHIYVSRPPIKGSLAFYGILQNNNFIEFYRISCLEFMSEIRSTFIRNSEVNIALGQAGQLVKQTLTVQDVSKEEERWLVKCKESRSTEAETYQECRLGKLWNSIRVYFPLILDQLFLFSAIPSIFVFPMVKVGREILHLMVIFHACVSVMTVLGCKLDYIQKELQPRNGGTPVRELLFGLKQVNLLLFHTFEVEVTHT